MVVEWSTDAIAPHLRFDAWREACLRNVCAVTLAPEGAQHFNARISRVCAGVLDVVDVRCDAHGFRRTRQDIESSPSGALHLYFQKSGSTWFEQEGRSHTVAAGDIIIADPDVPFEKGAPDEFDFRLWRVPRSRIEPLIASCCTRLPMTRLAAGEGENLLIRTWLDTLVHNSSHLFAPNLDLAFGMLCSLVASAAGLAPEMQEPGRNCRREAHLQRVKRQIELRAFDLELTTKKLAAELAMSRRTLHQLFRTSDRTFHEYLTQVRLDKAYELLRDCEQNHLSTAQIGLTSGFGETSTFYRRFKARYGITPGELRASEACAAAAA